MDLSNTLELKESFKAGYEEYEPSRVEADEVLNMYHNRQWTVDQSSILGNRGQPKETFNVIKLFARMLVGYYSTIVNTVKVNPEKEDSTITATVLQDTVDYVFRTNNFSSELS